MNEVQLEKLNKIVWEMIEDAYTIAVLLANGYTREWIKSAWAEIGGLTLGRIAV